MQVHVGTAGWAIGEIAAPAFPTEGSGLQRYAQVLPVSEINSSFHRAHRAATWARWRDAVPATFRFSVKIPKAISHQHKLVDCGGLVAEFLAQVEGLGEKLALLLLQLPPKLSFERDVATSFLTNLCHVSPVPIVVEPRHPSWFEIEVEALLRGLNISRVAADPAICPSAALPGGAPGLEYWRLHGSPVKYRSSYQDRLATLADVLSSPDDRAAEKWCIFDNTASSAAILDALALQREMEQRLAALSKQR